MLAKLELWIEYHYTEKLSYQISSNMHGILMELIDPEYADRLHSDGRKPFHQYISRMTENSFLWTICALNREAKEKIIDILVNRKTFYMKHKELIKNDANENQNCNIKVRSFTASSWIRVSCPTSVPPAARTSSKAL